jgi:hypothetical protein
MKRIALLTAMLLLTVTAWTQAARVDIPLLTSGPNVPFKPGPLPQALWVANATAYLCAHPSATLAACQASPITTYTDSTEGTACPSTTQLVQLPGNTCTAVTGAAANIGAWVSQGIFDYWVVSAYGSYGPYTFYPPGGGCQGSNDVSHGCTGATTAAGALANLGGNPRTVEPFLCDPVYAASIGSTVPSWCVGSTLDTWTKSACALLTTGTDPNTGEIQGGGIVDMTGFGSTAQTIAGSVFTGCMSHQKAVEFLFPPAPQWSDTQTDGGCAFPLDEGSSIFTPGTTNANNGVNPVTHAHYDTGIMLAPTAVVDAIVCPAYPIYDAKPQQMMSVAGITVLGYPGAQVTHGLIDMSYIYSNSQVINVACLSANEACVYSEDSGQIEIVNPSFTLDNTGDSTLDGTPIVFFGNTIPYPTGGMMVGNARVSGGQVIGGNGGERVYIKENPAAGDVWNVNGTAITWMSSGASGNQVNVGANPTASATAFCAIAAWGTDPNLTKSTCTTLSAYPGMVRLLPVSPTFEQSFTATKHIETPSGAIPGTVYTLTVAPPPEYAIATASPTGTLYLTVNGTAQTPITRYMPSGQYTIAGTTITFAAPTPAGATIVAKWDKVKVKTYYNSVQIDNDGYGGWEGEIWFTDTYFEREGHAATTPAIGVYINDCWNCGFTSVLSRGGAIQGQDAFYVTGTSAEVKSNTFINDPVWGGSSTGDGWVNALTDTVTPQVIPVSAGSTETTLDQIIVNPDQWQQNIPSNTALVGLGSDILTSNGLFSGTGTVYSAYWQTYQNSSFSGDVTWALNTSDPPPSPAFNGATGGTSSQYVTIGANSTLTPSAAGIQDAAGVYYSMVAGTKYTVAVQAREVSGNIPVLSVFVGYLNMNCKEGQAYFSLTSTWSTYSFPCTALATITGAVTINVTGIQGAAGAVGQIAFGNIQMLPALGLVPGDLIIAQTNNTEGPFTGTAYCMTYQSAAQRTACLAGNTAATDQVVVSHGTGSATAAPTLSGTPNISIGGNAATAGALNTNGTGTQSWSMSGGVQGWNNQFSMIYPGAGVGVSTGSAWGTSLTKYGSAVGIATSTDPGATAEVPMVADGTHGQKPSASGALGTGAFAPAYSLPATVMQTNQANTLGAFAFNLAASTLTLPTTYTVGIYTITQPSATGTLALYSQIPAVGTWGALNYPTWVSGSEFVKMTAAGTFALDNTVYQVALSLLAGTYSDGKMCTYATTGTLLNCNTTVPTSFPGFGTTGSTAAVGNDSRITGAVPNTTTVNGHALSSNVVVSASDLTTGTLPAANMAVVPTIVGSGTISTLAAPAGVVFCTATCAVTIPQAAAGNEFCVRNAPGVSTVITLNALAASNYYELINHSGWGTAAHSVVSGGAVTDMICLHGYDATHYSVASFYGTWAD